MAISRSDVPALLLNVSGVNLTVTPEQFDRLCEANRDLRLELTKHGELIVMPPTGGETGRKSGHLFARVWNWNDRARLGDVFDSSTGYDFTAFGGGKMSPDVSWIERSRLLGENLIGFIPIVPDFVIELRSPSDRL
jgi:Uma2 family endonuclease